jgi:hypothetical protein
MERKRKLPARGASRTESAAKKRTLTPPENRSVTPAPAPPVEEPPPPLPKSIQPGKPLPTVEDAQSEGLPMTDFQSVQERYVSFPTDRTPCRGSDSRQAVVSFPSHCIDHDRYGSAKACSNDTGRNRSRSEASSRSLQTTLREIP